jgi:hypothetical protein
VESGLKGQTMSDNDARVAMPPRKDDELRLPSQVDPARAEQLVGQAKADGVDLVGPGGLLGDLTKQVSRGRFGGRARGPSWVSEAWPTP